MAIRLEISGVEHPFKLCIICKDALGYLMVTLEPGHASQRQCFLCNEHLGQFLQDFGDSIIRRMEQEKGDDS